MGLYRFRFDKDVDRRNIMGAHKEQGKAWLDDERRDLELKTVMWGRIEGGDRSKLSLGS